MKFKTFIINEQEPAGASPMGGPPGLGGGPPPMGGPPGLGGGPDLGGGAPMGGSPSAQNEPPLIPKLANVWNVLDSILGTKKENPKDSGQKKKFNKETDFKSPLMS